MELWLELMTLRASRPYHDHWMRKKEQSGQRSTTATAAGNRSAVALARTDAIAFFAGRRPYDHPIPYQFFRFPALAFGCWIYVCSARCCTPSQLRAVCHAVLSAGFDITCTQLGVTKICSRMVSCRGVARASDFSILLRRRWLTASLCIFQCNPLPSCRHGLRDVVVHHLLRSFLLRKCQGCALVGGGWERTPELKHVAEPS